MTYRDLLGDTGHCSAPCVGSVRNDGFSRPSAPSGRHSPRRSSRAGLKPVSWPICAALLVSGAGRRQRRNRLDRRRLNRFGALRSGLPGVRVGVRRLRCHRKGGVVRGRNSSPVPTPPTLSRCVRHGCDDATRSAPEPGEAGDHRRSGAQLWPSADQGRKSSVAGAGARHLGEIADNVVPIKRGAA